MSQYEIHRQCGHVETIQIYGTDAHGERGRRADREATRVCSDCYRAGREATRAAESAAAAERSAQEGLPALTGTDGQVAWAETIRGAAVDGVDALLVRIAQWAQGDPGRVADADRLGPALTAAVAGHTDAVWWIEHRDAPVRTLHIEALTAIGVTR